MLAIVTREMLEKRSVEVPPEVLSSLEKLGWYDPQGEKPKFVWLWTEAVVWNLPKEGFTLRVPRNTDGESISKIQTQVTNQMNFFYGMIGWLVSWAIDDSIRVPYIWNDPSVKSSLPEGVITMQTVKWRTLLYHVILDELRKRFGEIDETALTQLTDDDLINKYFQGNKKMFIDMFAMDKFEEVFWEDLKDKLEAAIRFLERKWLEHGDIHLWNIMIANGANGKKVVYLIDFWKSTIHYKSQPFIQSGRDHYLSNYPIIWN